MKSRQSIIAALTRSLKTKIDPEIQQAIMKLVIYIGFTEEELDFIINYDIKYPCPVLDTGLLCPQRLKLTN